MPTTTGLLLYRLRFDWLNGRWWPCRESDITPDLFVPMSFSEASEWSEQQGFIGPLYNSIQWFADNYELDLKRIFAVIREV